MQGDLQRMVYFGEDYGQVALHQENMSAKCDHHQIYRHMDLVFKDRLTFVRMKHAGYFLLFLFLLFYLMLN